MTSRPFFLLFLLAGLLFAPAGCRHIVRREERPVSILISGPVEPAGLPRAAALAAGRREHDEMVWLVVGPVTGNEAFRSVVGDRAMVEALALAGVDAVLFGPEFLEPGVTAAGRLVSGADLQLLSCNIVDSLGEPVGHPMLIQRSGGVNLGFTAAWTDTADPRLRVSGVSLLPVERAVAMTLGLLRMHCEAVGLIVRPAGIGPDRSAGYDFVIGPAGEPTVSVPVPTEPGRMVRLELSMRGGEVSDFRVIEEQPAGWPEDPAVLGFVDSLAAVADSILAEPVAELSAGRSAASLTRLLQDAALAEVDGFVSDRPLFESGLGPGRVDARAVLAAMPEPGRLVFIEVTGWVIDDLTGREGVELRWRAALSRQSLDMVRRYRLAATPGFLARHPLAMMDGYEVDDEPAWRVVTRLLAGEQGVR